MIAQPAAPQPLFESQVPQHLMPKSSECGGCGGSVDDDEDVEDLVMFVAATMGITTLQMTMLVPKIIMMMLFVSA